MATEPVSHRPPQRTGFQFGSDREAPEYLDDPLLTDGTVGRRIVAYLIDLLILAGLNGAIYALVVMTFGLFAFVLPFIVLLPAAYHILLVSSESQATLGQRVMGLKVITIWGERPTIAQAGILFVLFYLTIIVTSGLLLLWAIFDNKNRCLHDILSGTMIARADRLP